jgi:hypothetical protein
MDVLAGFGQLSALMPWVKSLEAGRLKVNIFFLH